MVQIDGERARERLERGVGRTTVRRGERRERVEKEVERQRG